MVASQYPSRGLSKVASAPDRSGRLVPAVEYTLVAGDACKELRQLWLTLRHPNVFEAIRETETGLLLHYAAITGDYPGNGNATSLARHGASLAFTYRGILATVGCDVIGWFMDPFTKVDAAGRMRALFHPLDGFRDRMAPELKKTWPRGDQRTIVYLIGEIVSDRIYGLTYSKLQRVIDKCRASKPDKRYQTLAEAGGAFEEVAADPSLMTDPSTWRGIERAMGWMEYGHPQRALEELEAVPETTPYRAIRKTCFELVRNAIRASEPEPAPLPPKPVANPPPPPTPAEIINSLLVRRRLDEALTIVEALTSDDANNQYLRGKVLFALGRLDEARQAFDRASLLQPRLLAAMLLRREVDRALVATNRQVGTQAPSALELPTSLEELRGVLTSGRTADAISALSDARFADNMDAQLMLARFQLFAHELEAAMQVYERVAQMPEPYRRRALVGQATVMLEEAKLESALAMFDRVCAEAPTDVDASEGRARVLELLNRDAEAAAEYRRFISLATSRSDVRVRVAQLWLAEHG